MPQQEVPQPRAVLVPNGASALCAIEIAGLHIFVIRTCQLPPAQKGSVVVGPRLGVLPVVSGKNYPRLEAVIGEDTLVTSLPDGDALWFLVTPADPNVRMPVGLAVGANGRNTLTDKPYEPTTSHGGFYVVDGDTFVAATESPLWSETRQLRAMHSFPKRPAKGGFDFAVFDTPASVESFGGYDIKPIASCHLDVVTPSTFHDLTGETFDPPTAPTVEEMAADENAHFFLIGKEQDEKGLAFDGIKTRASNGALRSKSSVFVPPEQMTAVQRLRTTHQIDFAF